MIEKRQHRLAASRHLGLYCVFGIVGVIALGVLFAKTRTGHQDAATVSPPVTNGTLRCVEPFVDFGNLYHPAPQSLEHRFEVENISAHAVTLEIASKSCSCTGAALTEKELLPSEKTHVPIAWRLPPGSGERSFYLSLQSTPGAGKPLVLGGTMRVLDCLTVKPRQVCFGEIRPHETKTADITIIAPEGTDISDETLDSIGRSQPGELRVSARREDDWRIVLTVSLTGKPGEGNKIHHVILRTGNPLQPEIHIPVEARHLGLYELEPCLLAFSHSPEDQHVKSVRVVSHAGAPAIIERVSPDNPARVRVVAHTDDSGRNVTLAVRIDDVANVSSLRTGRIDVFVRGQHHPLVLNYACLPKAGRRAD